MLANFHTHTTFCDGKSTPEEVVLSAINLGFSTIGFSGHGYTPFDLRYCMKDSDGYLSELARLREKYRGRIRILSGIEEDAFAPVDRSRFDYVIGSSHYLRDGDRYLPIDSGHDLFLDCLRACRGDVLTLADNYYGSFCRYLEVRKPDIIGHFDLVVKMNETLHFVDEDSPEYRRCAIEAAERLAGKIGLFELNTGAVARGFHRIPYPAPFILKELRRLGFGAVISSDCHRKEN